MKKIILIILISFSTIIFSDNLYLDKTPIKINPSVNAFNNYSELGVFYNYDTENTLVNYSTPFYFFNLYFSTEYDKKLEKFLYSSSSSMALGDYFSIGGAYFYSSDNNSGNISAFFRNPWIYLGYTYGLNNLIEHSIQIGLLLGEKISPFATISKSDSNWNFSAGLSLLDFYGFDLSYEYKILNDDKQHLLNISFNLPNLSIGASSLNDKLATTYFTIKNKRKRNVIYEGSNYWLNITLYGPMTQTAKGGIIDGSNYSFIDLVTIVRKAVDDENIKGILFEIDKASLSTSQAEELLNILKKKNKSFRVYLKANGLGDYLLASASEKSAIHPATELAIQGPNITIMFYKNLLQLLGVKAYFFKRAEHKTAPEMFTETSPTKYNLSQVDKLVKNIKLWVESSIENNKKLDGIEKLLNNAPYSPEKAVELSLISEVSYLDDFILKLRLSGVSFISPSLYNTIFVENLKIDEINNIAVLTIEGAITETKGLAFGFKENYRKKILNSIAEIANDIFISGVIVRIDSPGGSGFVSDEINHALYQLKKIKPVYISIAGMSASGGYYISVAGEKIFANKMSIVGSIGAYTGKFVITGLIKRLMVGVFTKAIWKNGNLSSMFNELTKLQITKMEESIDDFYMLFLKRVKDGRPIGIEKLKKEIAGGRIYLGEESKKINLIDEIGGFNETLDALIKDKDLTGRVVLEAWPKSDNFLMNLFSDEKKLLFKLGTMINLMNTSNLLLSDYEIEF